MGLPKNSRHKDICQFEVLKNIGKVFLITGSYAESLQYNNRAIEIMKKQKFFREDLLDDTFFSYERNGLRHACHNRLVKTPPGDLQIEIHIVSVAWTMLH